MKKKVIWLAIIIIIAIIVVGFIRFLAGEDEWVCKNGQWVKHGQPANAMPTTLCK